MNPSNLHSFQEDTTEQKTDIAEILKRYGRFWYWYVLSAGIALFGVYVYLRYTVNIYSNQATVLIQKSSKEDDILSGLSSKSMSLLPERLDIMNEIAEFKSQEILTEVAQKLRLNVSYYLVGNRTGMKRNELYKNSPVSLVPLVADSLFLNSSGQLRVIIKNSNAFEVFLDEKYLGRKAFGTIFTTAIGKVKIFRTAHFNASCIGSTYIIEVVSLQDAVSALNANYSIARADEESDLINITTKGEIPQKNADLILALLEAHDQQKIKDQSEVARNTTNFINERITGLTKELDDVEIDAENFKQNNDAIEAISGGEEAMSRKSEIDQKIIETSVQLKLNEYLTSLLAKSNGYALLPSNLGFEDGAIVTSTAQYNKFIIDRDRLLKNSKQSNPQVTRIEEQLNGLRITIKEALEANKSRLKIILASLQSQEKRFQDKISTVPSLQRQFRDIERQQKIKETLYIYLLQKREENEISTAAAIGNTKLISHPLSNTSLIAPKRQLYYLIAFSLGFWLPIGIIYLRSIFDNKVRGAEDTRSLGLPSIGEIPIADDPSRNVVALKNSRSYISETFRLVRSNLSFLFDSNTQPNKTILVTSTIAGEGKTFISINLAHVLSHSNKRVLVIGLDLRAPKIAEYVDLGYRKGVSNYISSPELTFDDILIKDKADPNIDFIISGDIPPNPPELILRERLSELIAIGKSRYDYVIMDSAPLGLVSDSMPLVKFADVTIYVVRANYLERRMLALPAELYHDKKIPNLTVLVNAVDPTGRRYSYGYAYDHGYAIGYGAGYFDEKDDDLPFFQRLLSKISPRLRSYFHHKDI